MDQFLQRLLKSLGQLPDEFRDLREGLQKAIDIAGVDPEMALTRSRKVLELVVREVYERRCREPPGTRPLENLLQRLVREGHFPAPLDAYASTVRMLGNVGTHGFGAAITAADVQRSLAQLAPILLWYLEVERPDVLSQDTDVLSQDAGPLPAWAGATSPAPAAAAPDASIVIVPKGLRSFDAKDADFFLDLLPGPKDKDGLPESIRFWKHGIEAGDGPTFTVGVIYGPSGCGKSSLVKAGLLPRLAGRVFTVYAEATAGDTEARLLKGLRKRCPDLPDQLDLTGALAALRQGKHLSKGQKVLLVLDQFEQWLHARRGEDNTELVQALRQCDGEHVQCLVLVRDDFWVALSRFMGELHIELLQGENLALVDLFDLLHARHVLAAFGRAFGRLPRQPTKDQEAFLDRAIQGLAQDNRVISVRLSLFAEMLKGRPWTLATLAEVGGTEGIGVTFLEETFCSSVAGSKNRFHQHAARAVLMALLPEQGTDIKGNMQPRAKLLEASGYVRRPRDFEELLRILDSEVRLITPTEPEGKEEGANPSPQASPGQQYYQLTHDYLVRSLREWLRRKQKETRRGRAEARLTERAALWSARPERRHLPSWWELLNIRLLTRSKGWTSSQRVMIRKATRYHALRGFMLALLLALLGWGSYQGFGTLKAHSLRDRLLDANTAEVPAIVKDMAPYRPWIDPLLQEAYEEAQAHPDRRKQLHVSLALLPVEPHRKKYLYARLLDAATDEVLVLRDALAPHKEDFLDHLWTVVGREQPAKGQEQQRLRAACALASYAPDSEKWSKVQEGVVKDLVAVPAVHLATWLDSLRPVREQLLSALAAVFRDARRRESLVTEILADYAADQPRLLADLLMDAGVKQFAVLYPKLEQHGENAVTLLQVALDQSLPPDAREDARERLTKRRANAAVALLRMNRPERVWPLLAHSPDARVRSYLIHRIGPFGVDARVIVQRLQDEPDVTIRRALILSLGEFGPQHPRDAGVMAGMRETYRTATDPGLHAASEWLLRQWTRDQWLNEVNKEWAKDAAGRQRRIQRIKNELARRASPGQRKAPPQWYVNGQGQTMVVIPGPVEFQMGSPTGEAGRADDEVPHRRRIKRTFAIAAKPVTVEQYRACDRLYVFPEQYDPTLDCPAIAISWYQAAAYCNWLSEREGIPSDQWCYETDPKGRVTKLKDKYLSRAGYRLPTEAEWEYACRAGSVTSRCYGQSEELLGHYAWYLQNSDDRSSPAGRKKPNDLGLFDLHGNVWCWCQDRYAGYLRGPGEQVLEDREGDLDINSHEIRVLRGGSFFNSAGLVRSAYRGRNVPPGRSNLYVGFRPARTFPAE